MDGIISNMFDYWVDLFVHLFALPKELNDQSDIIAVGSGTVELVDLSEDADEIVTVTENIVDGQSNVVKTTFKYNDGNVKTFVAVQTLDENGKNAFAGSTS